MAKKIALLLTLVMMFTISCVFATDADIAPISEEVVPSETVVETTEDAGEAVEATSGEEVAAEPETSGEEVAAEPETSGEEVITSGEAEDDHDHEAEAGNGAVVGAIIAVVIVVAIVAIVWILNKK